MLQYLKMLKDLSDQLKAADVPGKVDQVADFLTKAGTAAHELANTLKKYVGPQTVGAEAVPTDLDQIEAELSAIRRDASMVSIGPGLIALAPLLIELAELGLQLIGELRKQKAA